MRSKVFAPQDKGGFTSQICNENYDAGWRARVVFHCKRCQRRMPETWLDVFCENCVEEALSTYSCGCPHQAEMWESCMALGP